jgi:hypothetical protein
VGKCVVFMGPILHHLHLEVVMSIDYHYWLGGGGVIKAWPGVATWLLLLSLDDATPASPRYFFCTFASS